jgi:hypothetical protein
LAFSTLLLMFYFCGLKYLNRINLLLQLPTSFAFFNILLQIKYSQSKIVPSENYSIIVVGRLETIEWVGFRLNNMAGWLSGLVLTLSDGFLFLSQKRRIRTKLLHFHQTFLLPLLLFPSATFNTVYWLQVDVSQWQDQSLDIFLAQ